MPSLELANAALNPQQREAVEHSGSPLLVLAGAGSGKTRVITFKIAHLINRQEVDPSYITAVTFTNRAAREMRERAVELCAAARWSHICTFHSYGASFLRRYASQANINPHFSIYDDDESTDLLSILYPHESRTTLAHIAHKISRAKNFALLPTDDLTPVDSSSLFATYYERYQSYLEKIGNMDFGDLILRPLQILHRYSAIRREEQRRNAVLLIDEYQDTNQAQYALVKALYHSQLYLCAVGDDDQSIYRFRGADITHIIDFGANFRGSAVMRLEQNYRSTAPILSLADAVVNNNRRRHPKRLWTEQLGKHIPELAIFENDFQEARYCVEKIQHDWMQIETVILYRTNVQSRLFEAELTRHAIAYKIIGSVRFYNREEIKDMLAFLKFLYNPQDEISFRRIVNKPTRGIGAVALRVITARKRESDNLIEALVTFTVGTEGTEKGRQGAQRVIEVCHQAQNLLHSGASPASNEEQSEGNLGEVIRFISEESGLSEYHRNQDIDTHGAREQNIEELIRSTSHLPRSYDGLHRFLESIELESGAREERGRGSSDSYVTLMTMHNAKGLEFERVFIVGLQDGLFPRLTEHNIEEIEEERRLFYVAITRAKQWLSLTSYRIRNLYGRTQENSVTRFLEEIPEELFHRIDYSVEHNEDYRYGQRGYSSFSAPLTREPSEEMEKLPRFSLGENVCHNDYGVGVISARKLESNQVLIQVNFQSGRVAHFIERYAALDKVAAEES